MKTAISIPDTVFNEAEELATQLGLSRSQLYAKAVADYVARRRETSVTDALNKVYGADSEALDPALADMQGKSLPNPW